MDKIQLQPGVAYLCSGTTQQVLHHLPLPYTILDCPTTEEIILYSKGNPLDFITGESRILFIFPKEFKIYKESKKTESVHHELPEHLDIPETLYVFVICTNILGEVTNKASIKKLEGGIYTKLDLQNLDYGVPAEYKQYPHSFKVKERLGLLETTDQFEKHKMLVQSLTTIEGVCTWSNFSKAEVFKYFLIPGFKHIPIVAYSKAYNLQPYLEPYVAKIKDWGSFKALNTFAWWVYCCNNYWSQPYNEGITSFTNRKGEEQIGFRPSKEALSHWWSWLQME